MQPPMDIIATEPMAADFSHFAAALRVLKTGVPLTAATAAAFQHYISHTKYRQTFTVPGAAAAARSFSRLFAAMTS